MGIPKNRSTLTWWIVGILSMAVIVYWWFDALDGSVFETMPVKLLAALLTCVIGGYLMLINYGD